MGIESTPIAQSRYTDPEAVDAVEAETELVLAAQPLTITGSINASLRLLDAQAPANEQIIDLISDSGTLNFRSRNDDLTLLADFFTGALTTGILTFGSVPILPASDPTLDNQAVRKAYVDNEITGIDNKQVLASKSADTSRASTTALADDPDLQVAVEASTVYRFEALLRLDVDNDDTAPDIKYLFTVPTGATLQGIHPDAGAKPQSEIDFTTEQTEELAVPVVQLHIVGFLQVDSTAGNVTLQWAQNTSDISATNVKAGSWLKVEKT